MSIGTKTTRTPSMKPWSSTTSWYSKSKTRNSLSVMASQMLPGLDVAKIPTINEGPFGPHPRNRWPRRCPGSCWTEAPSRSCCTHWPAMRSKTTPVWPQHFSPHHQNSFAVISFRKGLVVWRASPLGFERVARGPRTSPVAVPWDGTWLFGQKISLQPRMVAND